MALIFLLSDARPARKLFFLAMQFVNTLLCEVVCAAMQLLLSPTPLGLTNLEENVPLFLLLRGVYLLLYVPVTLLAASLWDRAIRKAANRTLLWFILLPLSQWVMLEFLYVRSVDYQLSSEFYIIYAVFALVFLLADGVMYFAIRQLGQKQALEQKNALLEQQLTAQLEHYQYILDDMERVSNIRHDLGSQLATAYALLSDDKGDEARALLDSVSGKLSHLTGGFCANRIVDAILAEKSQLCRELGIVLENQVEVAEDIAIDRAELCALFANILNNAIAAARQTDTPRVSLRAGYSSGFFILREDNSAPAAGVAKRMETERLAEHGRGLTIIQQIAAAYGGEVKTERTEHAFHITVWLKLDREMGAGGLPPLPGA